MKKIILIAILVVLSTFIFARASYAQTNACNQRCDLDGDCGIGYRCYVGVCRLDLCPSSSTCVCGNSVAATPTTSPKASVLPTTSPKPTVSPKPKVTPRATATTSAALVHSPKTGASSWLMALGAIVLFFAGTSLAGVDTLIANKGTTPQEIVKKRQSIQR